jgi:FkbM family methyltransferase
MAARATLPLVTTFGAPLVSYAQNREDLYLWGMLGHRAAGVYVDVGCNHETENSVTRLFYERGWSGINIDANERFSTEYEVRDRDRFVHAGVGAEQGTRVFREFEVDHGRSTFNDEFKAVYEASEMAYVDRAVEVRTLDEILTEASFERVDFLKIDAEGMEPEVLRGLDLDRVSPTVIVVEGGRVPECAEVLGARYHSAFYDGLNTYFVDVNADDVSIHTFTPRVLGARVQTARERSLETERDALAEELARERAMRTTGQHVRIEHAIEPRRRDTSNTPGGMALRELLATGDVRYRRTLQQAAGMAAQLSVLTVGQPEQITEPYWDNGWLPPLDALILCHLIRTMQPRTYLEIGSGNSTKFARWAIRTGGLDTRIVSIDPHPRAEVDELCDQVVRAGLEEPAAGEAFGQLTPGDVVFFDGSHYCFQNSDVAVFYGELVHAIPAGCIYGIHDIWLPEDYPEQWLDRFYNEQYMLVAWLLGGADGDQVALPAAYVSSRPQFAAARQSLIDVSGAGPESHGCAFWLRRS